MNIGKVHKDFDLAELQRRRRASTARKSSADLVAEIAQITPKIERLLPGQALELPLETNEDGSINRTQVHGLSAKLTHVCAAGREWAGRDYAVRADPEANDGEGALFVIRLDDLDEPRVLRKRGPKPASEATEETATEETEAESSDS